MDLPRSRPPLTPAGQHAPGRPDERPVRGRFRGHPAWQPGHRFRSLGVLLVVSVAAASCWPPRSVAALPGLDPSWRYLLTAAHGRHLRFGHDLVFTYGPLGWLFSPAAASWPQLVASSAVTAALLIVGFAALPSLLRRALPPGLCDLAVLVAASLISVGTAELLASMVVLILLARLADADRPVGPVAVGVAGVMGGVALTTKFGVGELLVAVGLVLAVGSAGTGRAGEGVAGGGAAGDAAAAVARRGATRALGWAVAVAAGFAAAWLGTGQRVGDVAGFVRGSAEIQRGYQTAMVFDAPGRSGEAVGDAVALVALLAGCVVLLVRARGRRVRAAALAAVAVAAVCYDLLQAYVRHDPVHDVAGQSMACLVAVAFLAGTRGLVGGGPPASRRGVRPGPAGDPGGGVGVSAGAAALRSPVGRGSRRATAARLQAVLGTVAAGAFLVTFAASSPETLDTFRPPSRWAALSLDATRVVQPDAQASSVRAGWEDLHRTDPYPAPVVALLRGRTVIPVPLDITGAAAWGMHPVTLPVPQTYSAYTGYLDRLNSAALLRAGGVPVLRRLDSGRGSYDPMWESPRFVTDLVCHYREGLLAGRFQVLARDRQRCVVSAQVLAVVSTSAGQLVRIPRPAHRGDGVTMTIVAHPTAVARLVTALVRVPRPWQVQVDTTQRYVLAPRGLGEPMVVVMPPGLWTPRATVGGDDTTLRFTGVPPLTITFRELVRTAV